MPNEATPGEAGDVIRPTIFNKFLDLATPRRINFTTRSKAPGLRLVYAPPRSGELKSARSPEAKLRNASARVGAVLLAVVNYVIGALVMGWDARAFHSYAPWVAFGTSIAFGALVLVASMPWTAFGCALISAALHGHVVTEPTPKEAA